MVKSVGVGGVNAIFSGPEVADDVISRENVGIFQDYVCANSTAASFSNFGHNRSQQKYSVDSHYTVQLLRVV